MQIGRLKTIYCLFFFPAVFQQLKKLVWWKGLVSLIVSTFLVSLLFFVVQFPSFNKSVNDWLEWFSTKVPEIVVNDADEVTFNTTEKIPFESSYGSFLLIMEDKDKQVDQSRMTAPSGLWLSSSSIVYWFSQKDGQKVITPFTENGKFLTGIKLSEVVKQLSSDDRIVSKTDYEAVKPTLVGSFFVTVVVMRLMTMFFYIFAIVVVNKLLRSPVVIGRSFMDTVGIYSFASIPAMAFAVIYSSLPVDFLDFASAYLLALLFYIFFICGRYILPEEFLLNQQKKM